MQTPLVVKLGGSLSDNAALRPLLKELCAASGRLVVVPGGGPFADAVRTAQAQHHFSDRAAHRMALVAMAQYGLMLADLAPRPLRLAWSANAVQDELTRLATPVVWLPDPSRDALELEASWNVTSDTLALWLAARLNARRLVLVKSCQRPARQDLAALSEACIVDAAFAATAAQQPEIALTLVYAADAIALRESLAESI
jgi:5-(aminomethyl)-3-furanmethanol phosphate kinase